MSYNFIGLTLDEKAQNRCQHFNEGKRPLSLPEIGRHPNRSGHYTDI